MSKTPKIPVQIDRRKGGNYSREETIDYKEVLTAETIQRRKLFMGGNYMRK